MGYNPDMELWMETAHRKRIQPGDAHLLLGLHLLKGLSFRLPHRTEDKDHGSHGGKGV
jgi:hypothetical protein